VAKRSYCGPVFVAHVSFVVDGDHRRFERWFGPLAAATRGLHGCELYELLCDPFDPHRGVIVEAWTSTASRNAYLLMPHHIEMVAEGSRNYGMRDFRTCIWGDAGEMTVNERNRSEQVGADRAEMRRLVVDRLTQPDVNS
jgi:quinol monooxygenase YgiN